MSPAVYQNLHFSDSCTVAKVAIGKQETVKEAQVCNESIASTVGIQINTE